jgi:hypothetical protein
MNKESKPRIPIGEKSFEQTAAPPLLIPHKISQLKSRPTLPCTAFQKQEEIQMKKLAYPRA